MVVRFALCVVCCYVLIVKRCLLLFACRVECYVLFVSVRSLTVVCCRRCCLSLLFVFVR